MSTPTTTYQRPALVAAANCAPFDEDQPLTSRQLADAVNAKRDAFRQGYGDDGQSHVVATIKAPPAPEHRYLGGPGRRNESHMTAMIDAVTNPAALTAAGVCAPYSVDYAIDAIGVTDRPLKASLPQFVADRGGLQFRRDIDVFAAGNSFASASGSWSMATDATPGGATKNILEVGCNTVVSAEVAAITQGVKFSNITNRFDPEATAANTQAVAIAHAKYAELALLNSMMGQVTATFSAAKMVSGTRDTFVALDKLLAYARSSRRLGEDRVMRIVAMSWLKSMMRADIARAMHTSNLDQLALLDDQIDKWFAIRNVIPTWVLDGRGAQAAIGTSGQPNYIPATPDQNYAVLTGTQTVPAFPTQGDFLIYPEGGFVYLDGGSLDIGLVRDQQLVQSNRYIQFMESFEGVYRKSVDAYRLVVELAPTGGSSGTVAPSSLTS